MYLILEEEVYEWGDISSTWHAIHVDCLTDLNALMEMHTIFEGFKIEGVYSRNWADHTWGLNKLTGKWEEQKGLVEK